jgi:hypothetical protein
MTDFFQRFFATRVWSIYPFIPPLFSLVLSIFFIPLYDRVLNDNLRGFLNQRNYGDMFQQINGVLKGRGLQIAYLTEIPVFVISVISTLQSNHPKFLIAIVIAVLIIMLIVSPKVFLSQPDYLSNTKFPEKGWPQFLAKKGFTQLAFHASVLAALNIILIIVIAVSLPTK